MASSDSAAELRRGLLAHMEGNFPAADAHYRRAMLDEKLAEPAHLQLIRLLEAQRRWEDALAERREALRLRPGQPVSDFLFGTGLLALGRYAEGWPYYEARAQLVAREARPTLPYPEWDGRPVRSLSVWDEQGYGDAIQFARFLPQLAAQGVEVTLVCRQPLGALLTGLAPHVVPASRSQPAPAAEAWTMIASLPGRLGVTLETLPNAPYLEAPADRRQRWPRVPGFRIGVATKGRSNHPNDARRSLSEEAASFVLSLPGALNLVPGAGLPIADFADTAAVIETLDLVITVDTAVAHLAGAMGKPCWVLLPYAGADWRWLHDRTDSPWYPSVRLYRQPADGDWASVLRAVAADLPVFFGQAR